MQTITPKALLETPNATIVDIREVDEYASDHVKGAINMPLDSLRDQLDDLDPQVEYIVSCQTGLRSYNAERLLRGHGFAVENLNGAYGLYQQVASDLLA